MVLSVYEKKKLERLNQKGIVIEELYYNTNNSRNEYFVRSSDGKMNDKIIDKALYQKRYFKGDECIRVLEKFNPNLHFTILDYNNEEEIVRCPNCGAEGKIVDFIDGCPYCFSSFNFGIHNSNVIKMEVIQQIFSRGFWRIHIIFSVLLLFAAIFIRLKFQLSWGIIISTMLYVYLVFFSNSLIVYFVYLCINSNKKESTYKISRKSVWNSDEDEDVFYKNLYTEMLIWFYSEASEKDLIDFDIINYKDLTIEGDRINIQLTIRKVYFIQDTTNVEKDEYKVTMLKNVSYKNHKNISIFQCSGCGAAVNISDKECKFCGNINNIKNEWIMGSIEKIKPI